MWEKTVDRYAENEDFWQSAEGDSKDSIIATRTDFSKGMGQKLTIRNLSGYYNEPHYGDTPFGEDTEFEKDLMNEYDLTIDVVRHATSYNERAGQITGLAGEISRGVPQRLGEWLGRLKSENLDMMFVNTVPTENILRPNGKSDTTLAAADGLSWKYVMTSAGYLGRLGGERARVSKNRGANAALRLTLVASRTALTVLRLDSDYVDRVKNAGVRGMENPIFRGLNTDIDGINIVEREIIDHDGEGAIGSPQEPRAKLGVAIAAGTTTFDVTGGGNATSAAKTEKLYFKYFGGYAYKFSSGTTLTPDNTNPRYLLIINPPNAATDPNKIGFYSYTTGNNGNKITIVNRLGSAASGARVTTLGGVTWNAGVWAGKQTEVHPIGSLILEANANGEPIGYSFLLGRAAALRGYGIHRAKRGEVKEEDGFLTKVFIRSYFGQRIRINRQSQAPGVVVLKHALHYQDLSMLPTTV